jgi:hypothetical protein
LHQRLGSSARPPAADSWPESEREAPAGSRPMRSGRKLTSASSPRAAAHSNSSLRSLWLLACSSTGPQSAARLDSVGIRSPRTSCTCSSITAH